MEQNENTQPGLEQQLAEAEERGYRRGLNEQIESRMREPGVWESDEPTSPPPSPGFEILSSMRRSVWE